MLVHRNDVVVWGLFRLQKGRWRVEGPITTRVRLLGRNGDSTLCGRRIEAIRTSGILVFLVLHSRLESLHMAADTTEYHVISFYVLSLEERHVRTTVLPYFFNCVSTTMIIFLRVHSIHASYKLTSLYSLYRELHDGLSNGVSQD